MLVCPKVIIFLRRSAAFDMSCIPDLDSLSSVSVASVLNSQVAIGLNLLAGPFPLDPSGLSFQMVSISVNMGVGVPDLSGSGSCVM